MDEIQSAIKRYILEQFLPDANPDELIETTPLITGGILDSLASVRLVMHLEQQFGIAVEAYEVNVDNLDTIERIAQFVRSKRP